MTNFTEARDYYRECREEERRKLRDYLIEKGFSNISQRGNAGYGRKKYSSGKRFEITYDLSNWKYIEASMDDVNFLISFQPFEMDPGSHNQHTLIDRIGFYCYTDKYNAIHAVSDMVITDIELPLDEIKMERLSEILKAMVPCQLALDKVYHDYNLV